MELSRLPANRVHVVVRDALAGTVAGEVWASATTDITGALTLEALPADGAGTVSAAYSLLTWWSATNLNVGVSTYGPMNQLLRTDWTSDSGSSSEQFAYDPAQNLLSRTTYVNGIAQGGDGFVHDRLNRLTTVNRGGALTTSVFHGASTMRASTTAPDGNVTSYLNDGVNVIASTTNGVTSSYGYFRRRPLFGLSSAGSWSRSPDRTRSSRRAWGTTASSRGTCAR